MSLFFISYGQLVNDGVCVFFHRFDKAMVALRRKLAGHHPPGEESGAGEEERHPIRVKKEHAHAPQVAGISE